jgi:hypothetical protein
MVDRQEQELQTCLVYYFTDIDKFLSKAQQPFTLPHRMTSTNIYVCVYICIYMHGICIHSKEKPPTAISIYLYLFGWSRIPEL